jgi:hypothetical protein
MKSNIEKNAQQELAVIQRRIENLKTKMSDVHLLEEEYNGLRFTESVVMRILANETTAPATTYQDAPKLTRKPRKHKTVETATEDTTLGRFKCLRGHFFNEPAPSPDGPVCPVCADPFKGN